MARVEIASFVEAGHADLAVSFLRRHRIKASVQNPFSPRLSGMSRTGMIPETSVCVEAEDVTKATALLKRVMAGEFAEADPQEKSRRGLGAALAIALLPESDFKAPSRLAKFAPFIVLIVVAVAGVIWRMVTHIGGG
jgi:hypothetical protein